jgi:hypothetical protein
MRLKKIQKSRRIAKAKNGRDTTDINVDAYAKLAKRKIKEYLRLMKKNAGRVRPDLQHSRTSFASSRIYKVHETSRIGAQHSH